MHNVFLIMRVYTVDSWVHAPVCVCVCVSSFVIGGKVVYMQVIGSKEVFGPAEEPKIKINISLIATQ